jgi:hypothetical protein
MDRNIGLDVIDPAMYLKAMGEDMFLILAISWIITAIFAP